MRAVLVAAKLFILLSISPAFSEIAHENLDAEAYRLYQQVFSPFCAGRSLNDCPSSKAHELKLEMRQKLEQGVAPEVILEDVIKRFGEQYRAVPLYSGFGKFVWLAPIAFLLFGAVLALGLARGKRALGPPAASGDKSSESVNGSPEVDAKLKELIKYELNNLD